MVERTKVVPGRPGFDALESDSGTRKVTVKKTMEQDYSQGFETSLGRSTSRGRERTTTTEVHFEYVPSGRRASNTITSKPHISRFNRQHLHSVGHNTHWHTPTDGAKAGGLRTDVVSGTKTVSNKTSTETTTRASKTTALKRN